MSHLFILTEARPVTPGGGGQRDPRWPSITAWSPLQQYQQCTLSQTAEWGKLWEGRLKKAAASSSCAYVKKKEKTPVILASLSYTLQAYLLCTQYWKYIYMYFSLQLEQPCGGLRTDWCQLDCSTLYKLPLTFLKPAPSSWEFWNANWAAKSSLGECFGGWEVRHVGSAGSNKHCWVLAAARLRLHLALLSTLLHRSLGLTPPAPAWALHTRTHRCPQPLEGTAQEPNPRPLPLWWGLLTAAGEAGSHVMLMPTETAPITALIRPVRMKNSTWDGCSR